MSKAKIVIEFIASGLLDKNDFEDWGFDTFEESVRWLLEEEGTYLGIVDDEYKILSIEEIKE